MAQKRMFDKKVVESDKFIDLPNSSKALYFMAGMDADDKGFFQPRKLQKMCGFSDDDFKILIAKGFFITFQSGVMVVTDWNKNNWLDSRRITETEYTDELNLLKLINQRYEFKENNELAKPLLSENSIDKNSIEYNIYNICPNKTKDDPTKIEILDDVDIKFEQFWNLYPKKEKKKDTLKWFKSHKPNQELFDKILDGLEKQKKSRQWSNKQYIPLPSSWLNGERWEDELTKEEFEYQKKGKTSAMDEVLKESQNGTIRF